MMRGYLPLASRWEINIGLTQDPLNRPLEDLRGATYKRGIVSAPDKEQRAINMGMTWTLMGMRQKQMQTRKARRRHQPTAEEIYQKSRRKRYKKSRE